MLGSEMIVAPMVEKGNQRKVLLPKGKWQADDGAIYSGGKAIDINIPIDRIPYFCLVKKIH